MKSPVCGGCFSFAPLPSSFPPLNRCSFEVTAFPSRCSRRVSPCVLTLRFNSVQQSLAEMKGRQVWKALWSVTLKPNGSLGFHANFGLISAISKCKQKKKLMQMGRIWYFCKDLNVCLLTRHPRRICVCSIWNCLDDIMNEYADTVDRVADFDGLFTHFFFCGKKFFPKTRRKKVECRRKYANNKHCTTRKWLCVFAHTC